MADLNSRKLNKLGQEDLKAQLVELGIDIDYSELAHVQQQAEGTVELPVPPAERSQSRIYQWIVNASRVATEALSIAQVAVINGVLAPFMALALAYVEWDRTRLGISQFDATHANMLAFVAISAYIVLTMIEAHYSAGHEQERTQWNIKKGLRGIRNFAWGEPTTVTEVQQVRSINQVVQMLIVISASFGSLQGQFDGQTTVSFQDVFAKIGADYRVATGVVIMSLLALSLLRGLHWSLFRVYRTTVNLVGDVEVGDNRSFLAAQQSAYEQRQRVGEEAVKMYLIGLILERQKQLSQSKSQFQLTEPTNSLNGLQNS